MMSRKKIQDKLDDIRNKLNLIKEHITEDPYVMDFEMYKEFEDILNIMLDDSFNPEDYNQCP